MYATNEMVIHFKDIDDFAKVKKLKNGIVVGERKVLINDLTKSLVQHMEKAEIISMLLDQNFNLEPVLEEFIFNTENHNFITTLFNIVSKRMEQEDILENQRLYVSLLCELMKKVDVSQIDSKYITDVLEAIFSKAEQITQEEVQVFNKLLIFLLDHLNLHTNTNQPITKFLNKITQKIKDTKNEELLKKIFNGIAMNCKQEWIDETLRLRRGKPDEIISKTPILPPNCIYYHKTSNGTTCVVLQYEKRQRDSIVGKKVYKKVGYPKLLFAYWIKDNRINMMKILTVKDDDFVEFNTPVYRYPYSNVFLNFDVCWEYKSFNIHHLHQLNDVTRLFFEAPNSNHLVPNGGDIDKLFAKNQNKSFNDEELIPTHHTMGELLGV